MQEKHYLLSFDTCNGLCSASLFKNGESIAFASEDQPSMQAERLFFLIDKVLKSESITYKDLNNIALSIGPGSFTGVRIGISVAKGLYLATRKPIISVSCFLALALVAKKEMDGTQKDKNITVVMDAKRNQLYTQSFDSNLIPLTEPKIVFIEDIKLEDNHVYVGEGANLLAANLLSLKHITLIDSNMVGYTAYQILKKGVSLPEVKPLYIRQADTKI